VPVTIDGVPFPSLIPKNDQGGPNNLGSGGTLFYMGGLEGYDVAHGQLPDTRNVTFKGRNLNASDAGTNNVLISANLVNLAPLKGHIHVGSTITLASVDGKSIETVTVVGTYQSSGFSLHFGPILTTREAVASLTPAGQSTTIFYMKIDSAKVGKALQTIGNIAPNASVLNFANIGDFINNFIGDILLVLTTIASLSLLAGVIIIANAVALAMLERRRELGILKSVGYTSRTILGEVLIENGVVGGTGALLAMLLVTLATSLLGQFVFKTGFGVSWYIAIGLIVGIALLAMVTAAFVAWGATRVRPLEVLRYE
jgi:ABC-type antimicrobial peptide transport system permease subunit